MDKRPNIPKQHQGKPSKLLMACALVFAFSLPYFLVTHFSHNKKNDFSKNLALPDLDRTSTHQSNRQTDNNFSKPELAKAPPNQLFKLAKKAPPLKTVKDNEWQTINPRSGDSMATIFRRLGLSAQNLHAVLQKNPHAKVLTTIKPGQKLQFLVSKQRLEQLIIPMSDIQTLTVYRQGSVYQTRVDSKKTISQNQYITGVVNGSLYSTAQRLNIPSKLIRQMTQILNKEIDFAHAIRAGDQFSIAYDALYVDDKKVGIGDILAVSYTNLGKTFQAVRHTKANGDFDFYTPQGESLKKAFSRYPIKFSHISSTFALSRYHPVLHYRRAHKGIDLAAPIGTPIQATGDGVITIIDRHNGYGNMIKIKHDKKFSTVYGHMLKFQKGLSKGSKVKRGQVIGYVGQTGLATGPHCHYELHVNNQPKNPTTIPLPTAAPISSREIAAFKAKTKTLLSRLKLVEEASRAGKKNIDLG
ncbi:peptidase M24 [Legionella antarctica]|uniref:Peptidase M24 n=1 Tax=Legionella antarctica TaxID=2708020 RepID=A0A6F8T974_9GAMM|nr:peptidoglycan DD-metalloendopeptidase family protein [Legionella antarctica]BCA96710.1 peptidase M24 [Legionella antarctica]